MLDPDPGPAKAPNLPEYESNTLLYVYSKLLYKMGQDFLDWR